MSPEQINIGPDGMPHVVANVAGGVGRDVYGLHWADTTWAVTWQLGRGSFRQWPVNGAPGTFPLLWAGLEFFGPEFDEDHWLVMAEETPNGVANFDTVAAVDYATSSYGGAVAAKWRWAVASPNLAVLAFASDGPGRWREVTGAQGVGDGGVAAAPLDDSTALVVSAGVFEKITWGRIREASWINGGQVPTADQIPGSPRLRKRPSGGQWLVWCTDNDHMSFSTYRDGAWDPPEMLSCAYRRQFGHSTKFCDLSRDDGEYPVVAWDADDDQNLVPTVCVCLPMDSGFTVADEIEGSELGVGPVVARDRNGDAWVAWTMFRQSTGMVWTHTYTTATTTTPRILSNRALRGVSWILSQPAPETWWAVLRSRNGDAYEEVARVRASQSANMSWIDRSPAGGTLRYKIRRECLDTRYQWESSPGHWPPVATGQWTLPTIALSLRVNNVTSTTFEVSGAGEAPVDVEVFDLQGRRVLSQRLTSAGSEDGTIRFDLGTWSQRLGPGIYFARAHEENGRSSKPAKVLVLR